MTALRHGLGLAMAGAPALSLFGAQTLLLSQGRSEVVLAMAQYGGLLGLIYFAFDGLSGLGPAILRLRHDDETIRAAYKAYRLALLCGLLTTLPFVLVWQPDWWPFLVAIATSLVLRLHALDHDLDRHDRQHWAMLAQNGWMIILALSAVLFGRLDGLLAGLAVFLGTIPYALLHRGQPGLRSVAPTQSIIGAMKDLLALMLTQGLGQIYGRATLFALGTLTGPTATLAIYAKQVFNAGGLLLQYLRRVELRTGHADMRLSLSGQAVLVIVGGAVVGVAAARLDLGLGILATLIIWQVAEKISVTGVYAMQLSNRHASAMSALVIVIMCGIAGMSLSYMIGSPLPYIASEVVGFGASVLCWMRQGQKAPPLTIARQA